MVYISASARVCVMYYYMTVIHKCFMLVSERTIISIYFLSCTFCEYRAGGSVCTAAVVILSSLAHSVNRTVGLICAAVVYFYFLLHILWTGQ